MRCITGSLALSLAVISSSYHGSSLGALGFLKPRSVIVGENRLWSRYLMKSATSRRTSHHHLAVIAAATSGRPACARTAARGQPRMSTERGTSSSGGEGSTAGGDGTSSGGDGGLQSEGTGAIEAGGGEPKSLAALVESTFVIAAATNSYTEGLKAFIQVVKEAYERGYTVPALTMEVSFVPSKTAGRDLYQDEVELRSIWIALIYLTLEQANWPQKIPRAHGISPQFMDRFAVFVANVMNAAAKGHNLQTLKLEEVMRRGQEPRTPMESAVLSQSMRIVFSTLELMKEGWSG